MDISDLQFYMNEAKRHPLLTREEEVALAKVYNEGRDAEKALEDPSLTKAERRALNERVWRGHQARDRFLNANLRLVVAIAKRYPHAPFGYADLIQEGNIGMMRALEKFDHSLGYKFSTYASWWIRQSMSRAIQQADMIRLPVNKAEIRNRVRRLDADGVTEDEVIAYRLGVSPEEVARSRCTPIVAASLDEPAYDGGSLVGDLVEDEDAVNAEVAAILADVHHKFDSLFDGFPERDRLIFLMRYGDGMSSLEDIGETVGLTRERVRQILLKHRKVLRDRARALGMA